MPAVRDSHIFECVSENPGSLPRIRVLLPGDVPGRLTRWRQGPDGRWWAGVEVYVAADAVRQVSGEDYTGVPRVPADQQYVLQTLPSAKLVLHKVGCWAADGRLTPVPPGHGDVTLRFDDTEPCQICTPKP
jgi:hypothetical protein